MMALFCHHGSDNSAIAMVDETTMTSLMRFYQSLRDTREILEHLIRRIAHMFGTSYTLEILRLGEARDSK